MDGRWQVLAVGKTHYARLAKNRDLEIDIAEIRERAERSAKLGLGGSGE